MPQSLRFDSLSFIAVVTGTDRSSERKNYWIPGLVLVSSYSRILPISSTSNRTVTTGGSPVSASSGLKLLPRLVFLELDRSTEDPLTGRLDGPEFPSSRLARKCSPGHTATYTTDPRILLSPFSRAFHSIRTRVYSPPLTCHIPEPQSLISAPNEIGKVHIKNKKKGRRSQILGGSSCEE